MQAELRPRSGRKARGGVRKRRKRTVFTAAGAALIAFACTSEPEMVWEKPDARDEDFYRQRAYCITQGGGTAQFIKCMQNDGWEQVPKGKANQRRFTWLRSDGTPALRAEIEVAREQCRASSREDPGSPFYAPDIMQCVQSKGYRLVEESTK
jgi:hypothetical protein